MITESFTFNPLKFKGYTLTVNLQNFSLSRQMQTDVRKAPLLGSVIQTLGAAPVVFRAEGILFGKDAISKYNSLCTLFQMGGSGTLELPAGDSLKAYFSELKLRGVKGKNQLELEMTFVEDTEANRRG